jgi:hypothetical protein
MSASRQGIAASMIQAANSFVSSRDVTSRTPQQSSVDLEKTVEHQTEAAHQEGTIWHAVRSADLEQVKALVTQG